MTAILGLDVGVVWLWVGVFVYVSVQRIFELRPVRQPPPKRLELPVDPLAFQEAWDDVNEIERYCGLTPTQSPAPRIVRSAVAPTKSPAPRMVRTADDARRRLAELREDWEQVRQPPRPSNYAQIVGALYAEVDMLDRTISVLERKEAAQKTGVAK